MKRITKLTKYASESSGLVSRPSRRRRPLSCVAGELLELRRMLAVLTVNSEYDNLIPGDGLVTLREAIIAANHDVATDFGQTAGGADQIVFDSSLDGKTISLSIVEVGGDDATTGDLDITDEDGLTISGNASSNITIDARSLGTPASTTS